MLAKHRRYHQMLQRCEDWLKDPFADDDAEDFDFEGFLGEVAEYVESADNDVLLARVVTVSALYNVQCAEMDRENAIRDFSDAAEVSLRCGEAHESTLLLLLRAYAAKKLASLGNFDFYGHGFNAIAKALPKLEERSWKDFYPLPIVDGKKLFRPWDVSKLLCWQMTCWFLQEVGPFASAEPSAAC